MSASPTPSVKKENATMAQEEKKNDETTGTHETETSSVKIEPSSSDDAIDDNKSDENIKKEAVSVASDDGTATEPEDGDAMETDDPKEKVDEDPGNKDAIKEEAENESELEESSMDADSSEEKSIDDNSDNDELQQLYANADPAMRAVAEEMIKAAMERRKDSPIANKSESKAEDQSKSSTSTQNSNAGSPSSNSEVRKSLAPATLAPRTIINKGKEPSALELALKQQGISQSDQLRSTQFPFRLHNMLDDAERQGHAHIVSWCPGGDSFKIHKPGKLIEVLQKYFRQSKFKSFLRQLQGYNFKRITRGKDQGVVSHPLFLRGRRSVSTLMRRKRVGPKANADAETNDAAAKATATGTIGLPKKVVSGMGAATGHVPKLPPSARILPTAHHSMARTTPSSIHSASSFMTGVHKPSLQSAQTVAVINPNPQDVLCVDIPNVGHVQQYQGNRKLASIVQKITGHYTAANESVRTMIVNEITSRIQSSGSRFLKLSKDGMSWMECTREEMFRKVIQCFEQEIQGSKEKNHVDLTSESDTTTAPKILPGAAAPATHGAVTTTDPARRLPPRNQDVVLRGGPGSEKEGNSYLKTMIQANVGQQLDSFEMKRIKCRAILERMKRRGSRFFLKLKETDSDEDMYMLSDSEAQDVIYTAFCAEEKKVQSKVVETPTAAASSMLRAKALAGLDPSHPGITGIAAASQFPPRAATMQNDAALLSQLKAHNDMSLLASQGSLKRSLQGHSHISHENILEKRLRAETDEHIKILIERERQKRNDPYGASLTGRVPFPNRTSVLESSIPLSAGVGGPAVAAASSIEQILKERRAEEMLKSAVAARTPFTTGIAPTLAAEVPKSSNHFVEFLKKKYVKSAQGRAW